MNAPFWRRTIISLLLWALPVQWLAAAALVCAGHPMGALHSDTALATVALRVTSYDVAPEGSVSGPDALVGAHHPVHGDDHAHGLLAHADANAEAGQDGLHDHPQGKCASAGLCCLSAALVSSPTLPDFTQQSASADFAPLAQHHRAPVLGGPERPPRLQAA